MRKMSSLQASLTITEREGQGEVLHIHGSCGKVYRVGFFYEDAFENLASPAFGYF